MNSPSRPGGSGAGGARSASITEENDASPLASIEVIRSQERIHPRRAALPCVEPINIPGGLGTEERPLE